MLLIITAVVVVRLSTSRPETQAYIQKLEQEKIEKAKGQQADNRGFFAKYVSGSSGSSGNTTSSSRCCSCTLVVVTSVVAGEGRARQLPLPYINFGLSVGKILLV